MERQQSPFSAISCAATSVTYTIASGSGASSADWSDETTDMIVMLLQILLPGHRRSKCG